MEKHTKGEQFEDEILNKSFNETKEKFDGKKDDLEKDVNKKDTNQKPSQEKGEDKKPERCVSCEEYLKLKYQLAEVINKYKQLDGEFENYRKRTREEIKQATTDGSTSTVPPTLWASRTNLTIPRKGTPSRLRSLQRPLFLLKNNNHGGYILWQLQANS